MKTKRIKVITFVFNNRPLRVTKIKGSESIFLFKEDIRLIFIDNLKSLPAGTADYVIDTYFNNVIDEEDLKSIHYEGKVTPVINFLFIIKFFRAVYVPIGNDEKLELSGLFTAMVQDLKEVRKFLIDELLQKALIELGIDMNKAEEEFENRIKEIKEKEIYWMLEELLAEDRAEKSTVSYIRKNNQFK